VPPDLGANQARLHLAEIEEKTTITPVLYETLH